MMGVLMLCYLSDGMHACMNSSTIVYYTVNLFLCMCDFSCITIMVSSSSIGDESAKLHHNHLQVYTFIICLANIQFAVTYI